MDLQNANLAQLGLVAKTMIKTGHELNIASSLNSCSIQINRQQGCLCDSDPLAAYCYATQVTSDAGISSKPSLSRTEWNDEMPGKATWLCVRCAA